MIFTYCLCFEVWKPLNACPRVGGCIEFLVQVHVADGRVQALHDVGPQLL